MATNSEAIKVILDRLISGDPTIVQVLREEARDDGAGGREDLPLQDLGERTVTMAPAARRSASTRTYPEAGGIVFDEWVCYDTPDTPITTSAHTKDTLVDPRSNRFRVESRQELSYGGQMVGVRFRLSKES